MRSILYVALLGLAACGARSSHVPAWPKAAAAETDGGESLAPREPAAIAVAEADDDDDDGLKVTVLPTTTMVSTLEATTPAATSPAATPAEDPITVDEIVIEIDDDDD